MAALHSSPRSLRQILTDLPLWDSPWLFPILMGLSSRLVLCIAMLGIAPRLPLPNKGEPATLSWDVFHAWDSIWYERIVEQGYGYIPNGGQHSIAFFPLYPILTDMVMHLGLPFEAAAVVVNTGCFFGALLLLFRWMSRSYGLAVARWSTVVLAWCPYSLYGTVIYTEGVFFLCTIGALWSFEDKRYGWASFWGILSTAARLPGSTLAPAFLLSSWCQKRQLRAWMTSLIIVTGIAGFSLFCYWQFGDPLAFFHVQKGWRSSMGFNGDRWFRVLRWIFVGPWGWPHWKATLHPWAVGAILLAGTGLWRLRAWVKPTVLGWSYGGLWFLWWWFAGESWIKVTVVFGGLYLIWKYRRQLPLSLLIYAGFSYLIIFNTGLTLSTERYAYGIITVVIAAGLFLAQYPWLGWPFIVISGWILGELGVRFSQDLWVA